VPKNAKQRLRKKYERAEKFGRALCALTGVIVVARHGVVQLIYSTTINTYRSTILTWPIDEKDWERAVKNLVNPLMPLVIAGDKDWKQLVEELYGV